VFTDILEIKLDQHSHSTPFEFLAHLDFKVSFAEETSEKFKQYVQVDIAFFENFVESSLQLVRWSLYSAGKLLTLYLFLISPQSSQAPRCYRNFLAAAPLPAEENSSL
jgi:hypothetical protein